MKLLLLTNEYPPVDGGVATYCYEMTKKLHSLDQQIVVIAANKREDDFAFDSEQPFPIYRVKEHKLGIVRHLAHFLALWNYTHQYKPQLLWGADWRTGILVMLIAALTQTRYIVTVHGTEVLLAQSNWLKKKIALTIYAHADKILCVSRYTQELVIGLGAEPEKTRCIPLGVNYQRIFEDENIKDRIIQLHKLQGKKIILTLARLTPRKGQDIMIQAMPKVLEKIPEAVYLIAGRGEDEKRLRTLVSSLNLDEHVIFAGYIKDEEKDAYYQICDLYVMLSRQDGKFVEGFGLTLLEAGLYEKPVVGGRHGGVPDVVVEGETGLIVEPLNIEEVASAVITILQDSQLANTMGKNALKWIQESANWDVTVRNTLQAIHE